jgi:hypothetical protein
MQPTAKIPFVFLTAHAFSGSTLTSFLLGSHPEIATVGELTGPAAHINLRQYPCSCGRLFQEDPFWQAVATAVNQQGLSYSLDQYLDTRFDLGSTAVTQRLRTQSLRHNGLEQARDWFMFHFWPGHQKEMLERVRRNELFARAILQVTGKPIFLDTSKDPMRIRYLQLSPNVDLYVIHLVRDVRGVAASVLSRKPAVTARQAAESWLAREQNIQRLLTAVPPTRQIKVCYEEIAGNTLATLNRLITFVGAQPLDTLADFREAEQHILGNKMRKQATSEIRLDERWRTALSPEQLRTIDQVIGVFESPNLAVSPPPISNLQSHATDR